MVINIKDVTLGIDGALCIGVHEIVQMKFIFFSESYLRIELQISGSDSGLKTDIGNIFI